MHKPAQNEIVQQLMDITSDIIVATMDNRIEAISALTRHQGILMDALMKQPAGQENGPSPALLTGLQELVGKAIDAVTIQMGLSRGRMIATGIKKKILAAYGTVTVSGAFPEAEAPH